MARVTLTERARQQLAAESRLNQEAIRDRIDLLAVDPRRVGYPLNGSLRGQWACRVDGINYRIIFRIAEGQPERVVVRSIAHRARAYF